MAVRGCSCPGGGWGMWLSRKSLTSLSALSSRSTHAVAGVGMSSFGGLSDIRPSGWTHSAHPSTCPQTPGLSFGDTPRVGSLDPVVMLCPQWPHHLQSPEALLWLLKPMPARVGPCGSVGRGGLAVGAIHRRAAVLGSCVYHSDGPRGVCPTSAAGASPAWPFLGEHQLQTPLPRRPASQAH